MREVWDLSANNRMESDLVKRWRAFPGASSFSLCAFVDHMTSRRTQIPVRPPAALQDIVERALAEGADSVLLEPVPEGLEVCWMAGNTGLGSVVSTEEGNRITRFIVRADGLERHDRGVLVVEVADKGSSLLLTYNTASATSLPWLDIYASNTQGHITT